MFLWPSQPSTSNISKICQLTLFSYQLLNLQVPVPLVYTQLVILAVNIYFAVALFGQQFLRPTKYIQAVGG